MRSSHGLKVGLAAGIALMGASACATNSRQADIAYIEQPVETIYNNALKQPGPEPVGAVGVAVRRSAAPAPILTLGPARDADGLLRALSGAGL